MTYKYTKNFSIAEFASRDCKDQEARMCPDFMTKLQELRDWVDHTMIISSGIRSPEHNRAVGGSKNSMHLSRPCKACDVSIIDWTGHMKHRFLHNAFQHGFRGIGISKNFIHLDMRAGNTLWTY